jgi:NADH:ubiquinone oxidoreductase subunit F (NADH-binding)
VRGRQIREGPRGFARRNLMDFDSLAAVGSMAGSGGAIVMDDSRDMV